MKLLRSILIVFLLNSQLSFAQFSPLKESAEISILTVGPGKNLNDSFGHSAFRIKNGNDDFIFDYGRYDFNTPNFYLKFTQGKLNYLMGKTDFDSFLYTYTYYNRTVKEQVLNLTFEEKQSFYNYLINNYNPENRAYLYDFFFDNCATKIRDVTNTALNNKVIYQTPEYLDEKTFRTLIQDNLNYNTWGSFGIDLALGSIIDQKAKPYDYMFLPEYIHVFFAEVEKDEGKPLIKSSSILYQSKEQANNSVLSYVFGPFAVLALISIFIVYITYKDYKKQQLTKTLDVFVFSITGFIGVMLLFLWFGTDHDMTAYNYNLLWAMPLNLIAVFGFRKAKFSLKFTKYLAFLLLMLVLMITHWMIGVQRFAPALFSLIIALFVRFSYLFYYSKKQ
jgi:hypothetical protein